MAQRQYTDAELDALSKAVAKLSYAHDKAKAESNSFGKTTAYVIHVYGYAHDGRRVDDYSTSPYPNDSTAGNITRATVACYYRGHEVAI